MPWDPYKVLLWFWKCSQEAEEVVTLQEKVESLDMYHWLTSAAEVACHFKISEWGGGGGKEEEKDICEAITAAIPAGKNILHFLWNTFSSPIEKAAFMWLQDCYKT